MPVRSCSPSGWSYSHSYPIGSSGNSTESVNSWNRRAIVREKRGNGPRSSNKFKAICVNCCLRSTQDRVTGILQLPVAEAPEVYVICFTDPPNWEMNHD